VATYGAHSWTLNEDVAERVAIFERMILGRMFGRIKINKNWKKSYNKQRMQLFGDLDIPSFVRVSRLNWFGHISRKDSERKVSQVL
jgi:hypothetical protein